MNIIVFSECFPNTNSETDKGTNKDSKKTIHTALIKKEMNFLLFGANANINHTKKTIK